MARTKIGSNATFSGTQKGLSIVSDWCYAYSGEVSVTNVLKTLLEYQTESKITMIEYYPIYFTNHSEDFLYTVNLNGQSIHAVVLNDQDNAPFVGIKLLIPPNTLVTVTGICLDASTRTIGALMTGRIYDA